MEKSENPPPYIELESPAPECIPPPQVQATVTQLVFGATPQLFGPHEQPAICPHCKQQIVTRTEAKASTKTHSLAMVLCALGCWLCCCIPYFIDSCKSQNHYCPHCNVYLGTFQH